MVEKPKVITPYDDIIKRKASALFSQVLPEYETFENAPIGNKERAIFENYVPIGLSPVTAVKLETSD